MTIEALEMLRELVPDEVPDVVEIRGGLYEEFHRMIDTGDWSNAANAYLVEGAAGGGKSFALAHFVYRLCREYPGTNILVLRDKRVDLTTSWMKTWEEEILDPDDPYDAFILKGPSREGRRSYKCPPCPVTGLQSEITIGGLNMWERYRSTQFDVIHLVEGSEASKANIQGIFRAMRKQKKRGFTRRALKYVQRIPKRFVMIDTNPDAEEHHLNVAAKAGKFRRIKVTIHDNPLFWNRHKDEPTRDGADYLDLLEQGTDGYVYERLVLGIWSTAQGAMFEMWDPRVHCFQARLIWDGSDWPLLEFERDHPLMGESVELVDIIGAIDWGTRNAGALLVFGVDREARMYLLHEVYHAEKDIDWWAKEAVDAWLTYRVTKIVCDTDKPDNISTLNKAMHRAYGRVLGSYKRGRSTRHRQRGPRHAGSAAIARECRKNTRRTSHRTNWELLRWALGKDETGRPHLFASTFSRSHAPDPALAKAGLPTDFKLEVPRARWAPWEDGKATTKPKEEMDATCHDHALTAAAYAVAEVFGRELMVQETKKKLERPPRPNSWDALFAMGERDEEPPRTAWDDDLALGDDMDGGLDTWL